MAEGARAEVTQPVRSRVLVQSTLPGPPPADVTTRRRSIIEQVSAMKQGYASTEPCCVGAADTTQGSVGRGRGEQAFSLRFPQ